MSARTVSRLLVGAALGLGLCACGKSEASRVEFMSGKPKGRWFSDTQENASPQAAAGADARDADDAGAGDANEPRVGESDVAAQGGMSPDVPSARAGSLAVGGAGGSVAGGSGARGGAGAAGGASPSNAAVTLTFTTATQHMGKGNAACSKGEDGMSYGPCNLGAVWITSVDGKLVKVVNLWGKSTYTKHLVRYQTERAGMRPDVMASATLKMNEAHTAIWDHTDSAKQPVPAGPYKLLVEVADADTMSVANGMNAVLELSFDTTKRTPVSVPDMPYYTNVELHYE